MTAIHQVTMGENGEIDLPGELLSRGGFRPGAVVTIIDSAHGLVLLTRAQLLERVRADLAGLDLVGELISDRAAAP